MTAVRPGVLTGCAGARVILDGREYINFAGSTYLALGTLPEIRRAAWQAIESGAPFSCQIPSVYGVVDHWLEDVESAAATYCGTEEAVYFPTGHLIGAAVLGCIRLEQVALFVDEGAHFNLKDAVRLTSRPHFVFRHCDSESLSQTIQQALPRGLRPVVVTDGLFGTTGRLAPLKEYAAVIEDYGGQLVVDEAHSFGVLGARGLGTAEYFGVESIAVTAGTLSKAFCAQGGVMGCRSIIAGELRSKAPLRGANSGSPISAAAAAASMRYMLSHPERRERLLSLAALLRQKLRKFGMPSDESPAPIVAFERGTRRTMELIQQKLFDRGIYVLLSNYLGAGPEGVIRCAVFADHTESDFDALVEGLATALN